MLFYWKDAQILNADNTIVLTVSTETYVCPLGNPVRETESKKESREALRKISECEEFVRLACLCVKGKKQVYDSIKIRVQYIQYT